MSFEFIIFCEKIEGAVTRQSYYLGKVKKNLLKSSESLQKYLSKRPQEFS